MSDELSWKRWTPDDLSPPTAEFTPAIVSSDEGDAGAGVPELSEEEQRAQMLAQMQMQAHEQGFNAALAVLRLSRRYTPARLERACGMALATGKRSPRYRDVEPVLRSGQDRAPAGEASGDCGYVRGAGFYGEE